MATLNGHATLLQAVGEYVASLNKSSKGDSADPHTQNALHKFVEWCGKDKPLSAIPPSVIGAYADGVVGTGNTPQTAEKLQAVRKFLTYAHKNGLIEVRLAQHIRVRRPRIKQGGAALQEDAPEQLTAEGHARLTDELGTLKSQLGPLSDAIQKAAADKDVRENAPLEAAREDKGRVDSRIREIEATLSNAVVIDASARGRSQTVRLGTTVSVEDISSGSTAEFTVVSVSEANPMEKKISDVSPLGKALLGKAAGSEIENETHRGITRYKILEIS